MSNCETSFSLSDGWDYASGVDTSIPAAPAYREPLVETSRAAQQSGPYSTGRRRKRAYELVRQTLGETGTALASAVETRDHYTGSHQNRVARLACAIAQEMSLPEDLIEGVRMAAQIHDIGKLAVPSEVFNKTGQLRKPEWRLIRCHTRIGHRILKSIQFLRPVPSIVHQHHERLDGSGYPSGLRSGSILLEARILSVADVVEAMASHRPYRPALGIKAALQEIDRNRGKLYDPEAVDSCLRVFSRHQFSLLGSHASTNVDKARLGMARVMDIM